jgi:hypothetical protein
MLATIEPRTFSFHLQSKNIKIPYKTISLPMVLYGCETLTVTLREEHRLRTTCCCLHCYYCYHCCTKNFHMDRFCYVYIPSHIYQTHIFCLFRLFNSLLDHCVLMVQQKQNSQHYFLSI